MSQSVNDPALSAEMLAGMSHQAAHQRNGPTSVGLARAARDVASETGLAALDSETAVMEAHGLALLKDRRGCITALREAETAFGKTGTQDRPGWLSYYDGAYLAAKMAHCLRELGDLRNAERFARRSSEMSAGYDRGKLFNTRLTFRLYGNHPAQTRAAVQRWIRQDPTRGQATWNPELDKSLQWEADGQQYTASGLARRIYREATGEDSGQNGPKSWVLDDGRDLSQVAGETGTSTTFKSPAEVLADAEAAGVGGVLTPFLDLARSFDLPVRGYRHAITITPPGQRNRYLVWLNARSHGGKADVGFNHEGLAKLTAMKVGRLTRVLPNGRYTPEQAATLAERLRDVLRDRLTR